MDSTIAPVAEVLRRVRRSCTPAPENPPCDICTEVIAVYPSMVDNASTWTARMCNARVPDGHPCGCNNVICDACARMMTRCGHCRANWDPMVDGLDDAQMQAASAAELPDAFSLFKDNVAATWLHVFLYICIIIIEMSRYSRLCSVGLAATKRPFTMALCGIIAAPIVRGERLWYTRAYPGPVAPRDFLLFGRHGWVGVFVIALEIPALLILWSTPTETEIFTHEWALLRVGVILLDAQVGSHCVAIIEERARNGGGGGV
jgi:hypothetical protein